MHLLGKNKKFNPFAMPFYVVVAVLTLVLPLFVAVEYGFGVHVPPAILCVANLLTGMVGSFLAVMWLDVCSRMDSNEEYRFVGFALFSGAALFALVMLMPYVMHIVFAVLYGLGSTALLKFISTRAPLNSVAPVLEMEPQKWEFTREIEPFMIIYGMVFGMSFVYFFNCGGQTLVLGLLFIILGGGLVSILSFAGKELPITALQRIILCVTVLSCVVMPLVGNPWQFLTAGLVIVAWSSMLCVNYALVVRKGKQNWTSPVFRYAPSRLTFRALGFCIGWLVAAFIAFTFGEHSEYFGSVRLGMVVVLVAVFVIFMPDAHHHDKKEMEELGQAQETRVVTVELSESEIFDAKCQAAGKLFKLSPREMDILPLLAHGRNAGYIQEKFCISPHTVKSHIYSIYRKFDIHSQQKLMDFIEEYPLSEDELAKLREAHTE